MSNKKQQKDFSNHLGLACFYQKPLRENLKSHHSNPNRATTRKI